MANSVIFVSGGGYIYGFTSIMLAVLNGAYAGPEYTDYFLNTPDKYPNTADNVARDIGSASLEALVRQLRADDPNGTITLVGSSFGSTVISKVNDNLIAEGYPTKNISAVLIANPNDPNGGYLARFPEDVYPPLILASGGLPTQAGGMRIVSIKRQYDMASDAPAYLSCTGCALAWANAYLGFLFIHDQVYNVDLADPRNLTTTSPDGTLTSILVYTPQLPLTMPLRLIVPGPLVDALDQNLRPLIETAYIRPDPADPTDPANDASKLIPLTQAPTPGGQLPAVLPAAATATAPSLGVAAANLVSGSVQQPPQATTVPVNVQPSAVDVVPSNQMSVDQTVAGTPTPSKTGGNEELTPPLVPSVVASMPSPADDGPLSPTKNEPTGPSKGNGDGKSSTPEAPARKQNVSGSDDSKPDSRGRVNVSSGKDSNSNLSNGMKTGNQAGAGSGSSDSSSTKKVAPSSHGLPHSHGAQQTASHGSEVGAT